MSTDDVRKALAKAQDDLSKLTTSTAPNDEIALPLRVASRLASAAMAQGFSSDAALNNTRRGLNCAQRCGRRTRCPDAHARHDRQSEARRCRVARQLGSAMTATSAVTISMKIPPERLAEAGLQNFKPLRSKQAPKTSNASARSNHFWASTIQWTFSSSLVAASTRS
jgi:hypothetical protein